MTEHFKYSKSKPEHIKSIINNIISKIKEKGSQNKKVKIEKYINKTLGEHVVVSGLRKGSLYIKVNSSAWLQELNLMKHDLVDSINVKFKENVVKDIKIGLVRE